MKLDYEYSFATLIYARVVGFSRTITTYRENPISCRQSESSNTADRGNGQAAQKDCQIATQTTLDTKNHRGKPTTSRQICEKFSAKPY